MIALERRKGEREKGRRDIRAYVLLVEVGEEDRASADEEEGDKGKKM